LDKKRILIVADSMAMPRMEVHYDETWIHKLIYEFPNFEFIDKCRRASTSVRLVSDGAGAGDKIRSADLLEYYSPGLIITQIGITDCAPRLYKKSWFYSYLFHILQNNLVRIIVTILKKYRGRKEAYADVTPQNFEKNWKQYLDRCRNKNTQLICILIALPSNLFLSKSPEILSAINRYNSILIKLAEKYNNVHCLKPFTQEEIEICTLDEYHVNAKGHQVLAEKIIKIIYELLKQNKI
jgi:acyl-CoA thioesterase I